MIEVLEVIIMLLIIGTLFFGPSVITGFAVILALIGILFLFAYFGDIIITAVLVIAGIFVGMYTIVKISSKKSKDKR